MSIFKVIFLLLVILNLSLSKPQYDSQPQPPAHQPPSIKAYNVKTLEVDDDDSKVSESVAQFEPEVNPITPGPAPPPKTTEAFKIQSKSSSKIEKEKTLQIPVRKETPIKKEDKAPEPETPVVKSKYNDCDTDTLFVIDSTSSVRDIFEKHKTYALNTINLLNISPNNSHVGVIIYSSKYRQKIKISLNDPQDKKNVTSHVNSLPFFSGVTATGKALSLAYEELKNRRKNVPTNLVVITDGFSYDIIDEPVKQLHQMKNLRMFAVALSKAWRDFEMMMIAGTKNNFFNGDDSYKQLVERLKQCDEKIITERSSITKEPNNKENMIKTIDNKEKETNKEDKKNEMKNKKTKITKSSSSSSSSSEEENNVKSNEKIEITTTIKPSTTTMKSTTTKEKVATTYKPTKKTSKSTKSNKKLTSESTTTYKPNTTKKSLPTSTTNKSNIIKNNKCKFDIVFVIDASGSLKSRYEKQLKYASELVDIFGENANIALIKYSGKHQTKVCVPLGSNLTTENFKTKLIKEKLMGGTTYTDKALDKAYDEITGSGSRNKEASPVIVVFTDGFSTKDPQESAQKLHKKAIPVFAIGISDGHYINQNELRVIATSEDYVYLDTTFNILKDALGKLNNNC